MPAANAFREFQSQPSLLVEHKSVRIDGRLVGLAVSVGKSFIFYTTDDRLESLDGQRFVSIPALYAAAKAAYFDAGNPSVAA